MDSGSQIDNVQSFVEVIGDNDNLWKLLIGKEVINFWGIRGRIVLLCDRGKEPEIRVDLPIRVIDTSGTRNCVRCKFFKKEEFINEFHKIDPSFCYKEILELIQAKKREVERQEIERREARRWEVERKEAEKREAARRKVEKQALYTSLKDQFEQDFLNIDKFYQDRCTEYITFREYQVKKLSYVQSWIKSNLNFLPDLEQAAAIGAVEGHIQVVARAGSGKTSTLVNRALFLQKHCGIAPNEILLLAFNRKAAEEIKERFTLQLQSSIPHVMTFHALAYALVHPEKSILFNEPDGQQNKAQALQTVIDEYRHNPDVYEKIRVLMMAHFREDWERIAWGGYDKSPEEMLRYRRSLPREGLDGKYYKSFGEKVIANFLLEHNITYKLPAFRWNSRAHHR